MRLISDEFPPPLREIPILIRFGLKLEWSLKITILRLSIAKKRMNNLL
jgi:hypothetical protein